MSDFFSLPILTIILGFCIPVLIGGVVGAYIGYNNGRKSLYAYVDKATRYAAGVAQFQHWCSHMSPAYRLIAEHLRAVGEGEPLNAGSPAADEPCTVDGMREQLKRLTKLERNPELVCSAHAKQRCCGTHL